MKPTEQKHCLAKIALTVAASLLAAGTSGEASYLRAFGLGGLHRVAATEAASIGTATMTPDGTIELRLRATARAAWWAKVSSPMGRAIGNTRRFCATSAG